MLYWIDEYAPEIHVHPEPQNGTLFEMGSL